MSILDRLRGIQAGAHTPTWIACTLALLGAGFLVPLFTMKGPREYSCLDLCRMILSEGAPENVSWAMRLGCYLVVCIVPAAVLGWWIHGMIRLAVCGWRRR